jgi:hypothetical protein
LFRRTALLRNRLDETCVWAGGSIEIKLPAEFSILSSSFRFQYTLYVDPYEERSQLIRAVRVWQRTTKTNRRGWRLAYCMCTVPLLMREQRMMLHIMFNVHETTTDSFVTRVFILSSYTTMLDDTTVVPIISKELNSEQYTLSTAHYIGRRE